MRRNVNWFQFLVFILFFIFLTIPKNSLKFILEGKWEHLRAFWRGVLWHVN
jgi:hypothetical protein